MTTNGPERDEHISRAAFWRGVAVVALAIVTGVLALRSVSNPAAVQVTSGRPSTTVARSSLPPSTVPPSTVAAHPPADVKVLVLNAVDPKKTVSGPAAAQLKAAGYTQASPRDAPQQASTAVYFTSGYDADAAMIATALHLSPATVQPLPSPPPPQIGDVSSANVVVVVGPDAATSTG